MSMSKEEPSKHSFEKERWNVELGEVHDGDGRSVIHDAVFGDMTEDGPNFRAVGAMGAFVLMIKANIGLGVLSIPFVFQTLGLVPGIILIFVVSAICLYCDFQIVNFKINHPEMYSLATAGRIFGGRIGEETLSVIYCLFSVFVAGSGLVTISVSLNAVSVHAVCTAVFMVVAAVVGLAFTSIRTLGSITWLGWVGMVSIISALLTLVVAVGIQDRPAAAPQTGPWDKTVIIIGKPTFGAAMSAVNTILFATAAAPTYFQVANEMKDIRHFKKAATATRVIVAIIYVVVGAVMYHYCGQYVSSPALGSAGPLMKRVCYGLAIPALLVTLVIYSHMAAKYIFVRLLSGSKHLVSNSWQHWTAWLSCTVAIIGAGYIIGSAIPIFSALVSLIGSLFCPTMAMIPYSLMWFHDNWRLSSDRSTKIKTNAALNLFIIVLGVFFTIAGTYGAVLEVISGTSKSSPWSCADNSGST